MEPITVREAQRARKEALARIHAEVARYYLDLAPDYFQVLERFAEQLASGTPAIDSATLHLVAEAEGRVVGALVARLLPPEDAAKREITPELGGDQSADRVSRRRGGKPKARRRCPPCRGSGGMGTSRGRDDRRNNDLPRKPALGSVLGGTHELRGAICEPAQAPLTAAGSPAPATTGTVRISVRLWTPRPLSRTRLPGARSGSHLAAGLFARQPRLQAAAHRAGRDCAQAGRERDCCRSIATLSPISSVGALVAASRKPQWIQGIQRLPCGVTR